MKTRLWLCTALVLSSASASAKCPTCECWSELTAVADKVEPRDVAINARVDIKTVRDPSRKKH